MLLIRMAATGSSPAGLRAVLLAGRRSPPLLLQALLPSGRCYISFSAARCFSTTKALPPDAAEFVDFAMQDKMTGNIHESYSKLSKLHRYNLLILVASLSFEKEHTKDHGSEHASSALNRLHHSTNIAEDHAMMSREVARRLSHAWTDSSQHNLAFLMEIRNDLLALEKAKDTSEGFESLNACSIPKQPISHLKDRISHQIVQILNSGELQIIRISPSSSSVLLRKLQMDPVHAIISETAMAQRMGRNRTVFALVHPRWQDYPLAFLQIALANNMADPSLSNVQCILNQDTHAAAVLDSPRVAIFYSVFSTILPLPGMDLGNLIIKKSVPLLQQQNSSLSTFLTLSPVATFRAWMSEKAQDHLGPDGNFLFDLRRDLEREEWWKNHTKSEKYRHALLHLLSRYLLDVKKGKFAFDSIENFHLRNGAMIANIHHAADISFTGLTRSYGTMVNYLYDLSHISERSRAYLEHGTIAADQQVWRFRESPTHPY